VKKVCSVLGLKSTVDTSATFTTHDMKDNVNVLEKELAHIADVLKLRVWSKSDDIKGNLEDLDKELTPITNMLKLRLRSKSDDKVAKVGKVRSMLKAFFQEWSGVPMVKCTEQSRRTATEWFVEYKLQAKDAFAALLLESLVVIT
jgi:hypothetical protein